MGFGAIFTGVVSIAKALPELIKVGKEVFSLIQATARDIDSKKKAREFKEGLEHARKSKDTSKIEKLFRN